MTFDSLHKLNLLLEDTARPFLKAVARYYTDLQTGQHSVSTGEVVRAVQATTAPYLTALEEYEGYLLSIDRDKDLESELQRIVTKKNALLVIVGSLNKRYPPINDSQ